MPSLSTPISLPFGKGKDNGKSKGMSLVRGRMPTKRTINLAKYDVKKTNWLLAIPGLILIVALAFLFGKYAVSDLLSELSYEQNRTASLQAQVNAGYEKIDSFGELTVEYGHYTYSGMTTEELQRVDRAEIMLMFQRVILPYATVSGWNISGNRMTLSIYADSLQELNMLAEKLREEEIVEFCSISKAATYFSNYWYTYEDFEGVNGTMIIYLNAAGRGDLG